MTDYFSLIGQPRLPWIDPDELKSAFLPRSAEVHPDRFHQADAPQRESAHERYLELNAAYQKLRDAKDRVQHLLELELGRRPGDLQSVPPGTMELSLQIGSLCRDVDRFRTEQAKATSPMVKVQHFERALDWVARLQPMQQSLAASRHALESRLQSMNALWQSAPPPEDPARAMRLPLAELEEIYRQLSFLTRWNNQLQERIVALAL